MSFTDNFGNPKGLLGRLMLGTMEKEHLPMSAKERFVASAVSKIMFSGISDFFAVSIILGAKSVAITLFAL